MRNKNIFLTKCVKSLLFGAVLTLCLVGAVSAASVKPAPFSDIRGHKYEDAIEQLCDVGAINGNPDGEFCPDRMVTPAEFFTMLTRVLYPNDDFSMSKYDETWSDPYLRVAASHGIIEQIDRYYISQGRYNGNSYALIDKVLTVNECYARPLGEIDYNDKIRKAAIDYGLIPADFTFSKTLTRGEAAFVINSSIQNNLGHAEYRGAFPMRYELEYFNGMSDAFSRISAYFEVVPEEYVTFLNESGYTVMIVPNCASYFSQFKGNVAGVACGKERLIYFSSFALPATVPHEIAHALSFELFDDDERCEIMSSIYSEKAEVSNFIDEHKLYDADEFFAESFAYLISHKDDEDVINKFKTAAPATFEVISSLGSRIQNVE